MRRFISIREKLVLFFILLGIVSIGITSYLSYSNARSAILSRTFDQLTSLRIEKKKQIELFFSERKKDLFLLVQDESINSFSYNNEQDFFISDSSAFSEHALKILNSSVYSGIYIFYPETNSIKYLSLSNKRTDQSNILSANSLLSIITKDSNNLISISDYNNRTKQMSSNSVFILSSSCP